MLKDEKKILEEELGNSQQSNSNLSSQNSSISEELEIQKNKNDVLLFENNRLNSKIKDLELEKSSLKIKFDDIFKNVSNFNKGRENLSSILENSQSSNNKSGLGFKKQNNFAKSRINNIKKTVYPNTKTIKIWIPKTNSVLIKNKHIKMFMETVHNNKNYIYKGNSEPLWVWLPKI